MQAVCPQAPPRAARDGHRKLGTGAGQAVTLSVFPLVLDVLPEVLELDERDEINDWIACPWPPPEPPP